MIVRKAACLIKRLIIKPINQSACLVDTLVGADEERVGYGSYGIVPGDG